MGWVVSATFRPPYPQARRPIAIEYEAEWAPDPVWTFRRRENLSPMPGFELQLVQSVIYEGWKRKRSELM
jgi:hypothetical protein